jgi:hypothetical protein
VLFPSLPLIPAWVVLAVIGVIISLKIYYFFKYKDWFILSLVVPLMYTTWIYADEMINKRGLLVQPLGRLSTIILLLLILVRLVFDIYKQYLKEDQGL